MDCAHAQSGPGLGGGSNGLRRQRRLWQWAVVGSAALHGQGSRQGGSGMDVEHGRGSRNDDRSQGIGRARRTTVVQAGTLGGGGWKEAHDREGSGECDRNGMKMYAPPPPPPPLFFYKAIGQLKGPWESKGLWMSNFAVIAKFLPDFICKVKLKKQNFNLFKLKKNTIKVINIYSYIYII